MFVRIALMLLVIGSAAFAQEPDFTRAFHEEPPSAPIDESALLRAKHEAEMLEMRDELSQYEQQNRDLLNQIKGLRDQINSLKEPAAKTALFRPQVNVATSPSCGPCHAWKNDPSESVSRLPKRFIDVTASRPSFIAEPEWRAVQGRLRAAGATVPAVWWVNSRGSIKWLEGRYTDYQIEWSIQQDNLEAVQ